MDKKFVFVLETAQERIIRIFASESDANAARDRLNGSPFIDGKPDECAPYDVSKWEID